MNVRIIKPKSIFCRTRYELLSNEKILTHTVNKGFVSDGGTVPRLFWWLIPPVSVYFTDAVLHDYLIKRGFNRKYCDEQFRLSMIESGVGTKTTNFIYGFTALYGMVTNPLDYINYKVD
jgi:hypothetical protein